MDRRYYSPDFWRDRAIEARDLAQTIADAEAKAAMLDVAEDYERIARRYELIAAKRQQKNV